MAIDPISSPNCQLPTANSGPVLAMALAAVRRSREGKMNSKKKLASRCAVAFSVAALVGTSAFADIRHSNETHRHDSGGSSQRHEQRGEWRQNHDRGRSNDRSFDRGQTNGGNLDRGRRGDTYRNDSNYRNNNNDNYRNNNNYRDNNNYRNNNNYRD